MGHVRGVACAAAWLALLHACSSGYSSAGGDAGGAPLEAGAADAPSGDGAPSDAGPSGDAADAADAAGAANLLMNPDFELGCAGWLAYEATATDSTKAHGGMRACQICLDKGVSPGLVYQDIAFTVGEKLAGEAWFHADADASAASVEVHFNVFDTTGTFVTESPANPFLASATWTRASTAFTVPAVAARVTFVANVSGSAGVCAIVDDASATRLP